MMAWATLHRNRDTSFVRKISSLAMVRAYLSRFRITDSREDVDDKGCERMCHGEGSESLTRHAASARHTSGGDEGLPQFIKPMSKLCGFCMGR